MSDITANQMLVEKNIYEKGFRDGHLEAREYTKKILKDEVWEYHKLTDNFGMTIEQSKKVNELILKAHNEVLEKTIRLL